ncbi:hypothetical protein V6Z11_A13G083600 [Gossypium hirsutum]
MMSPKKRLQGFLNFMTLGRRMRYKEVQHHLILVYSQS